MSSLMNYHGRRKSNSMNVVGGSQQEPPTTLKPSNLCDTGIDDGDNDADEVDSDDDDAIALVDGALLPKTNGSSLMMSGFACACCGMLAGAVDFFKFGKNREGSWTCENLVDQLVRVMPMFADRHPGKRLLFAFDNSSNHHKASSDGLSTANMNLNPGGAQSKTIRDTRCMLLSGGRYDAESDRFVIYSPKRMEMGVQRFVDEETGEAKGMRRILEERALWPRGGLTRDAAAALLESQPDFMEQRGMLREAVETAGHEIIFYPKYHPETNFIEMIWCYMKRRLRAECDFSFNSMSERMKTMVNEIPVDFVRRAFNRCWRYIEGYKHGLRAGPELDFAVRKFSSHRGIPADQVQLCKDEYARVARG